MRDFAFANVAVNVIHSHIDPGAHGHFNGYEHVHALPDDGAPHEHQPPYWDSLPCHVYTDTERDGRLSEQSRLRDA